jgi:hypothetical protein
MSATGVVLDLGAGRAVVGDLTIEVAPIGSGGAIRVGQVMLRPLGFGERSRVVADSAAAAPGGLAAVAAAVLTAARAGLGEAGVPARGPRVQRVVVEAVAMHLAGARTDHRALGFAESAALAARSFGWTAEQVLGADADAVDRLVDAVAPVLDDAPGWNRILITGTADSAPAGTEAPDRPVDATAVRDALARDLLARATRAFAPDPAEPADLGSTGGRLAAAGPRPDGPTNPLERVGLRVPPTGGPGRSFDGGTSSGAPSPAPSAVGTADHHPGAAAAPSPSPAGAATLPVAYGATYPRAAGDGGTGAASDPRRGGGVTGRDVSTSTSGPRQPTTAPHGPDPELAGPGGARAEVSPGPPDEHLGVPTSAYPPGTGASGPWSLPGQPGEWGTPAASPGPATRAPAAVVSAPPAVGLRAPAERHRDARDLAEAIAALLDDEADLRGVRRS